MMSALPGISYMAPRHKAQLSQLAQYRLSLPDRPSQGWVADQLSDLLGEDVSQQAVGYWETGKVNLQKVHPRRLRAYASVLKISLQQLAEAVNLTAKDLFSDTALQTEEFFDESDIRTKYALPQLPPLEPELSDSLKEAIEKFGDSFPKLRETRWQHWLATTEFRDEPETPEDWLAVFLDFEKKINLR